MNIRKYRPAVPYAVALPIALAMFGGLLAITKMPTLLPLGLILVFALAHLASRQVPASPILAALFTVSPTLAIQVVGLIVLAAIGLTRLLSSGGPADAAHAVGFTLVGIQLFVGNSVVIALAACFAGWLAQRNSGRKEPSNEASQDTSLRADPER